MKAILKTALLCLLLLPFLSPDSLAQRTVRTEQEEIDYLDSIENSKREYLDSLYESKVINPAGLESESWKWVHIFKLDAVALARLRPAVSYHYAHSPGNAVEFSAYYSAYPNSKSYGDPKHWVGKAFGFHVEPRFYMGSRRNFSSGFYLGPYLSFDYMKARYLGPLGNSLPIEPYREVISFGAGLLTGFQYVAESGFAADFFIGAGARTSNIDQSVSYRAYDSSPARGKDIVFKGGVAIGLGF
ncbi:MAG: hypothetical protein V4543_03755 [Bacteroidota bacterium]